MRPKKVIQNFANAVKLFYYFSFWWCCLRTNFCFASLFLLLLISVSNNIKIIISLILDELCWDTQVLGTSTYLQSFYNVTEGPKGFELLRSVRNVERLLKSWHRWLPNSSEIHRESQPYKIRVFLARLITQTSKNAESWMEIPFYFSSFYVRKQIFFVKFSLWRLLCSRENIPASLA